MVFFGDTYDAGAALPTGINTNQVYYVISAGLTSNSFEISTTPNGAAVNTSAAGVGVFTINTQVWTIAFVTGSSFSDRSNFTGEPGQPSSWGCRYLAQSVTTPAFLVGPNSGNLISNLTITGGMDLPGSGEYRCQAPPFLIGIGNITNGAGTSRTEYVNLGIGGFYAGWASSIFPGSNGSLGDSNTLRKPQITDTCVGLLVNSQMNFINSVYDAVDQQSTTNVSAILGTGFNVFGGNYSTFTNVYNQLVMTGVTLSQYQNTWTLTATITGSTGIEGTNWPDGSLNNPLCAYNLQCGYGVVDIVTRWHGVVPWHIVAYNPFTRQIKLRENSDWRDYYSNSGVLNDFQTDVQAQTVLNLAETIHTFQGGGIRAQGVHVENGPPTTLVDTWVAFGNFNLLTTMKDILLNWNASAADPMCCDHSASSGAKEITTFFAQQTIPFILANGPPLLIDGLVGGDNVRAQDRVLVETQNSLFVERGLTGGLLYNFSGHPGCTDGSYNKFSGCFQSFNTAGFGFGQYDTAGRLVATAIRSQQQYTTLINTDPWRSYFWGQSPMWGVRPAPWSMPCVTPAQVTALASPTLTHWSQLQNVAISAIGSGYQVGDVLTLVGGSFITAAQVTVKAVGGSGGITDIGYDAIINTGVSGNNYSVEPASFTATGGHGSGASFSKPYWFVNYISNVPFLWGGQNYGVCDWTGSAQTKYALRNNNFGYSYFVNLTTANVPNLSWSSHVGSAVIYMNQEALELMFPGLVISLTASGGSTSCTSPAAQTETFMVTGVYPTLGYVNAYNAGQDALPMVANWTGGPGTNCTGTAIGQAPPNIVNPF